MSCCSAIPTPSASAWKTTTYAWQLAELGKGRLAVYNFGIPGTGPHEMLAGLQSGRFQKIIGCTPTHVVYFFIVEHIGRVTGRLSPWDTHGPRYRLDADGKAVRDGNFDTRPHDPLPDLDEGLLGWRRLAYGIDRVGTREETELTAAILIESAREIARFAPRPSSMCCSGPCSTASGSMSLRRT